MMEKSEAQTSDSKRDFLKLILGGGFLAWIGAVLYPIAAYLKPPKQNEVEVSSVKVGLLKDIEKDSGQIVKFGNKPVILVRTAAGDVRAFSAVCTHLECTVTYRKDFGMIWCACHNGKYDLNGRNVSGPPPRPLDELRVTIQGEEVSIFKKS
ncbi:MAG: Rieske (2Fe-2S) protein [Ignavibacteriales bacterium]|nr:Rieske (2Fe-2S) protein [Ignavibacteriales bacterium]